MRCWCLWEVWLWWRRGWCLGVVPVGGCGAVLLWLVFWLACLKPGAPDWPIRAARWAAGRRGAGVSGTGIGQQQSPLFSFPFGFSDSRSSAFSSFRNAPARTPPSGERLTKPGALRRRVWPDSGILSRGGRRGMGRRARPPRLSPTSLGRGQHKGRKATAEGETRVRASQLQPCRSNMCGNTAR